jgi:hypothetical protein
METFYHFHALKALLYVVLFMLSILQSTLLRDRQRSCICGLNYTLVNLTGFINAIKRVNEIVVYVIKKQYLHAQETNVCLSIDSHKIYFMAYQTPSHKLTFLLLR